MSVAIVGGNECMERRYKQICEELGHRARVFTKPTAALREGMGCPDLMIVFTGTVSHTMVRCAMRAVKPFSPAIEHSRSASASALKEILNRYGV